MSWVSEGVHLARLRSDPLLARRIRLGLWGVLISNALVAAAASWLTASDLAELPGYGLALMAAMALGLLFLRGASRRRAVLVGLLGIAVVIAASAVSGGAALASLFGIGVSFLLAWAAARERAPTAPVDSRCAGDVRDQERAIARATRISEDPTERRRDEDADLLRGLAAYLEAAREDERRRLARRLHDDLAQPLTALGLRMSLISRRHLSARDDVRRLNDLAAIVESLILTVRSMIGELRPSVLDDFGLAAAVRWQVCDFRQRTGIACAADVEPGDIRCSHDRAVAVFRILQEALESAIARPLVQRVRVELKEVDGTIDLTVEDDGSHPDAAPARSLPSSWAVVRMRARANRLGGDLEVAASEGVGGKLRLRMPGGGGATQAGACSRWEFSRPIDQSDSAKQDT